LDIIVESPEGQLVAFCIGWFDDHLNAGHIEPLGCHKDYRKYALGRVALSEVLRGLQSLGAETIYVETDSFRNTAFRLYEFFDFQVIKNVLVYRKNFEAR
jgi:ribosomal protein S18 acetylase RimI-like enzyme